MRTTLNLTGEALAKVRQLAAQRQEPMGVVASELIPRALEPREPLTVRNGVPLFASHGSPRRKGPAPDLELVNRLRDEVP